MVTLPYTSLQPEFLTICVWMNHGHCRVVQVLYDIEVSFVDSMVLKSMEDWLKLNAVKSFLIVHECKAEWDAVLLCFLLDLVDNMEIVSH